VLVDEAEVGRCEAEAIFDEARAAAVNAISSFSISRDIHP
jgi:hypothetical protein